MSIDVALRCHVCGELLPRRGQTTYYMTHDIVDGYPISRYYCDKRCEEHEARVARREGKL